MSTHYCHLHILLVSTGHYYTLILDKANRIVDLLRDRMMRVTPERYLIIMSCVVCYPEVMTLIILTLSTGQQHWGHQCLLLSVILTNSWINDEHRVLNTEMGEVSHNEGLRQVLLELNKTIGVLIGSFSDKSTDLRQLNFSFDAWRCFSFLLETSSIHSQL